MSKLLTIIATPNPSEASYSQIVLNSFINSYKEANPLHTHTQINIFDIFVPEIDGDMLEAFDALNKNTPFSNLSNEQQKALTASEELLKQFLEHDKYVFVTPLWNASFPARLKSYMDAMCVPRKTFNYTEKGSQGLIEGKKVVHIHSSGDYIKSVNFADALLREILEFIGIKDVDTIFIHGHGNMPHLGEQIKEKAKNMAIELGKSF